MTSPSLWQASKKMANGTLGGRSKVAQPATPLRRKRQTRGPLPFCVEESFDAADGTTIGPDLTWALAPSGAGTVNIQSNRSRCERQTVAHNADYTAGIVAREQENVGSRLMDVSAVLAAVPTNHADRRIIHGGWGVGAGIDRTATSNWTTWAASGVSPPGARGASFSVLERYNNTIPPSGGTHVGEYRIVVNGSAVSSGSLYSDDPSEPSLGLPTLAAGDEIRLRAMPGSTSSLISLRGYLNDLLIAEVEVLASTYGTHTWAAYQQIGESFGFLGAPTPSAPAWNGEIDLDDFRACRLD